MKLFWNSFCISNLILHNCVPYLYRLLLFSAFLMFFCLNVLTGLLSLEHLLSWLLKTHENPFRPQSLSWLKREKSSRKPRSVIFNENVQQNDHGLYSQVIVSEDQGDSVTKRFAVEGYICSVLPGVQWLRETNGRTFCIAYLTLVNLMENNRTLTLIMENNRYLWGFLFYLNENFPTFLFYCLLMHLLYFKH